MAWDRIRQFLLGGPLGGPADPIEPLDQQQIDMIAAMGQRMVDVVNESIQIAGHSKNIETRRSRVRVARERIAQLQEFAADYPFLKIGQFAEVEGDLAKIDRETDRLEGGCDEAEARADDTGWSIGNPDARHPYAIGPDHPAANGSFNALEFHATFQLRTPKRILERNDTVIPLTENPPSDFEPWMGVWFPIDTGPNILTELAPEAWADLEAKRTVASDAGRVKPAEYMPFLIAFRTIVEDGSATIAERIAGIAALFQQPEWAGFVADLQSAERVSGWFFPTVLSQISGLPRSSQAALSTQNIRTVAALRATDDNLLLAIKGIGPAKLAAIRQYCDTFDGDPYADRLAVIDL